MRSYLLIMCLVAYAEAELPALASGSAPGLTVHQPVARLGEIKGGPPVTCMFTLENKSGQALDIVAIERGCGCLQPRLERERLAAGEKATLHMDLRTLGHKDGLHVWRARVRWRAGGREGETPLEVHALVTNEVTLMPADLVLFVERELRQELQVIDRRARPLQITRVEASHAAIKVGTHETAKGTSKVVLEVNGAMLPPGRHDAVVDIYTSDPLYRHLQARVTLQRAVPQAVLVIPERAVIAPRDTTALIRLRPRGAAPLGIEKATCDDPAVRCTWAANAEHGGVVKLEVSEPRGTGRSTRVRIYLRNVAAPVVVPVEILAR